MIYAIGDIHGMYDPLKILVDFIYDKAQQGENITRVIFLGDLIDCGPSTKEVIDTVIKLRQDFSVTALLGNHEEMLLSFYHKRFNYLKVGSYWMNSNGGVQTIHSFYPQSTLFKTSYNPDHKTIADALFYEDVLKMDEVYEDFFKSHPDYIK